MTTSNALGQQLLTIPGAAIITEPPESYSVPHTSTIAITHVIMIDQAKATAAFTEVNCVGTLTQQWLWDLRRAVHQGLRYVRGTVKSDVKFVCSQWFDAQGNPLPQMDC